MRLIRNILITAISLLVAGYVVPGFTVINLTTAIIAALILGVVNTIIKPILLLLTLPINVLTLGLFTYIVNALMLMLTAGFIGGFAISGLLAALLGSLVISVTSYLLNTIFKDK